MYILNYHNNKSSAIEENYSIRKAPNLSIHLRYIFLQNLKIIIQGSTKQMKERKKRSPFYSVIYSVNCVRLLFLCFSPFHRLLTEHCVHCVYIICGTLNILRVKRQFDLPKYAHCSLFVAQSFIAYHLLNCWSST